MLLILALGMLRQKDTCDFEANLGYRVRFCLRKEKSRKYWVQWSFFIIAALRRLRQYC